MKFCPAKVIQHFRRTCCFHLQVLRVNQARNHHEEGSKLNRQHTEKQCLLPRHAGLLLGIVVSLEDGGSMFLQNFHLLS
jgi:hypothetical protein